MTNVARMADYRMNANPRASRMTNEPLAPWPSVDRYPNIIGRGLSLRYVSQVMRLCLTGYRQQYVDLASELLTLDPHAFSVVQKRVLAVGQGKVAFTPPPDEDLPDEGEREIAREVAAWVQSEINQIPDITASLTQLAWALYFAVSCVEKMLVRREDGSIGIESLSFVHYRRLSYPDPWKWDLYVWDQGLVLGPEYGMAPTQGVYGLNTETIRDKFIIHVPQVCGDYPTRDGLARELMYWMTIKHIAARLAPQYLGRFAIPFADVSYSTKGSENEENPEQPRIAGKEDIDEAKQAARDIGNGNLGYWAHPDNITAQFIQPEGTPSLTFEQWINICDSQMSKAASGGTLTTEVTSSGGNRAVASEQAKKEEKLVEFDAGRLAATLKRDIGDFLVENNPKFAGLPRRLFPMCVVHVNDDPDPQDVIDRASKGATAGLPLDADAVARMVRLPLIENPNPGTPRRMIPMAPVSFTVPNEVIGLPDAPEPEPVQVLAPGQTKPPAKATAAKPQPKKKAK